MNQWSDLSNEDSRPVTITIKFTPNIWILSIIQPQAYDNPPASYSPQISSHKPLSTCKSVIYLTEALQCCTAWLVLEDKLNNQNWTLQLIVLIEIRCTHHSFQVLFAISVNRLSQLLCLLPWMMARRMTMTKEEESDVKDDTVELKLITGRVFDFISNPSSGSHASVHVKHVTLYTYEH